MSMSSRRRQDTGFKITLTSPGTHIEAQVIDIQEMQSLSKPGLLTSGHTFLLLEGRSQGWKENKLQTFHEKKTKICPDVQSRN